MSNREEEIFYFDYFLQQAGYKPENIVHLTEGKDPPDFIIVLDGKRIGIEVTGFHSQTKGSGGFQRRPVEEAWRKFQQDFLMPRVREHSKLNNIYGRLSFKKLNLPPSSKYSDFAREIVSFSLDHCNLKEKEKKEYNNFGAEFPIMTGYLRKFRLRNAGGYRTWEWNYNVASVGIKEEELIATTIEPKINRLKKPGWADLAEKWLLVVSGHQLSQHMGGQLETS